MTKQPPPRLSSETFGPMQSFRLPLLVEPYPNLNVNQPKHHLLPLVEGTCLLDTALKPLSINDIRNLANSDRSFQVGSHPILFVLGFKAHIPFA